MALRTELAKALWDTRLVGDMTLNCRSRTAALK